MGRLNVKAKFISTYNNQISQSEVKPIQFVASVMELCGDQLCHLACDPTQSLRNRLPPCSSSVISVILSGLPLKLHSTVKSKWSGLLLKIQSYKIQKIQRYKIQRYKCRISAKNRCLLEMVRHFHYGLPVKLLAFSIVAYSSSSVLFNSVFQLAYQARCYIWATFCLLFLWLDEHRVLTKASLQEKVSSINMLISFIVD